MGTNVGLWIDHKKAIIVHLTDQQEEIARIISNVERRSGRTGGTPRTGHFDATQPPPEDSRQRHFTAQLNVFYDAVIAAVRGAAAILILGPAEAKDELKKRLEGKRLGDRIVGVETVDKLTNPQVAALVRQHFASPAQVKARAKRISAVA